MTPRFRFFTLKKILLLLVLGLGVWALFWFWGERVLELALRPAVGSLSAGDAIQEETFLKLENDRLSAELVRLQDQLRGLSQAVGTRLPGPSPLPQGLLAPIRAYDPAHSTQSLWVGKGGEHGVEVGDSVLAGGALVGRVIVTRPQISQVLLLTDLRSTLAVRNLNTGAQGLLSGKREDLTMERSHWLTQGEYFEASEEMAVGDLLVSSGLEGLFPAGLPVGYVQSIRQDPDGLFWQADVRPVAQIKKLSWVKILPKAGETDPGGEP